MCKISVVMPSLNVKDYIKPCMDSVVNQTLNDIEIICVDAGSDDGTLEILKDYSDKDSRIKLIHSDKRSYGYQMNLGIKNASGEYIAIVETDDFIDSVMFEDLYNLSKNGTVDIIKSNFYFYYENGNKEKHKSKVPLSNVENEFTLEDYPVFIDEHPSIWAGIYRREFLIENNISFREVKGGGWVDNPFFFETAIKAKSIVYRDNKFYYYYRQENPNSSTNDLKDFSIPFKRLIECLNILEESNCTNNEIYYQAYRRVFGYVYNVYRRDNYESHMDEMLPYVHKVMLMLDEDIILNNFNYIDQLEYYRFLSPLKIKKYDELSSEDYDLVLKENRFLYKLLDEYGIKNFNNIKNENDNLKKLNREILNSSSWKITKPLRKIRHFLKK